MTRIWTVLLMLVCVTGICSAQSTGTLNGRVTDPAGRLLPTATVTVVNTATGIARSSETGDTGLFTFSELLPGTYNVTVKKAGFAETQRQGATLVTGTTLTLDFQLGVAGSVEKIEVTSEMPLVDATQSMQSGTLQTAEVQNLPILNRNFSGLITLIPGARPTLPATNAKIAEGGGIGFGGSTGRAGAAEVDGGAFRDDVNGGTLFNLTLEGVQEFNVISHDYPAQYGLTSGGIVLITTKQGGNQLHGSAFAFGRNQDLTATDYLSQSANGGSGKPPYDREQFGGSLGGRILTDKLFWFGAVERVQQNQQLLFSSNAYQQAVIAKTTLSSLSSCPVCMLVGNAIVASPSAPQTIRIWQGTGRLDYQITPKHSLFARWLRERVNNFDDILSGAVTFQPHPDTDPNGSNTSDVVNGDSGVISETWLVNDKSVNTFAVTADHYSALQSCHCTLTGADLIWRNITFPDFVIGEPQGAVYQRLFQVPIQFKDTFSYERGNHSFKFGGDFITYPDLGFHVLNQPGGITMFADPSVIVSDHTTYPQGFLTPGAMSQMIVSTGAYGGPTANAVVQDGKEWSVFVQDDWKVKRNVTLNLGLHYAMYRNFMGENVQDQNRALTLLKQIGSVWGKDVQTPKLNLSPRGGFAWDLGGNGRNILRGSFGVYYDEPLATNQISTGPEAQPTLNNIYSTFTNTKVGVGALAGEVYGVSAIPAGPAVGATSYTAGSNSTAYSLDPTATLPYNEQFHIGYARQLTTSSVISADYTHVLGLHEYRLELINPVEATVTTAGVATSSAWDPNGSSYATCGVTGSIRRLTCPLKAIGVAPGTIGNFFLLTTGSRSDFEELDIHFEQRSRHVNLQATYTLSSAHAFGGITAGTASGGSLASQTPFQWNTAAEWGPTATDERNRAVVSGDIRVPFQISISPVFQVASARPYNCLAGQDYLGTGYTTVERCWQTSSGTPVAPNTAGAAPAPINALRGTSTLDLDARITKVQKLRGRFTANFFVEFYNLTNRANFGNTYSGTFTATNFRQPNGYFNAGLSLPTSRQLQLGARFMF